MAFAPAENDRFPPKLPITHGFFSELIPLEFHIERLTVAKFSMVAPKCSMISLSKASGVIAAETGCSGVLPMT